MSTFSFNAPETILAEMDTEVPGPLGTQVPVYVPDPRCTSGSGGSPFENVSVTWPSITSAPQSSMTRKLIGVGQATVVWKLRGISVWTAPSRLGAQT